jgi:hypothetical protein
VERLLIILEKLYLKFLYPGLYKIPQYFHQNPKKCSIFAHMEKIDKCICVCVCWGVNPQDEAIPNIRGIRQGNN